MLMAAMASGAMPLASVDPGSHELRLHQPALRALAVLPAPMCVLAIAGAPHEGKSTLLNMLSQWVVERWTTVQGLGVDFKVGTSILDSGTVGAWLRVFTGLGGTPLPGTRCRSLALIDSEGTGRSLSLDGGSGRDVGAHRLFALATLASSTIALNVT